MKVQETTYYTIYILIYLLTTTTTMKVHKVISLDYEIVIRLKEEENTSGLINSLLMNHYKDLRSDKEIIDKVKIKIKQKKEDKIIEKRIKKQLKEENEV